MITIYLFKKFLVSTEMFINFVQDHRDLICFSSSRYAGYIGSKPVELRIRKFKNKKPVSIIPEKRDLDNIPENDIKITYGNICKSYADHSRVEDPNYLGVFSVRGLTISNCYEKNNITKSYLGKICYSIYEDIYNKKQ